MVVYSCLMALVCHQMLSLYPVFTIIFSVFACYSINDLQCLDLY